MGLRFIISKKFANMSVPKLRKGPFLFSFFVAKYIYHLLVAKFDKPRVLENGCLVIFIEACLDIFLKSTKF